MKIQEYGLKPVNTADENTKKKIDQLQKDGSELVKGKFELVESNGGKMEFAVRLFPDSPITKIELEHGEICSIPISLARHINGVVKKEYSYNNNEIGSPGEEKVTPRMKFTPVDWV